MSWCFAASLPRQSAWQRPAQDTGMRNVALQPKSCARQMETVVFIFISPVLNSLCCQWQEADRD